MNARMRDSVARARGSVGSIAKVKVGGFDNRVVKKSKGEGRIKDDAKIACQGKGWWLRFDGKWNGSMLILDGSGTNEKFSLVCIKFAIVVG